MMAVRRSVYRCLVAMTATVLCMTVTGCAGGSEAVAPVVVSAAASESLAIAPAGSGPVVPAVDHAIVVERRATVTSVAVSEGARVHLGDKLLEVYTIGDSRSVATAVNQLRADQKELESVRARDGVAAKSTIALLAKVAADRQRLTDLKAAPTTIAAPADGRVSGLSVNVGDELTRTDVVMHVVDDGTLRVTVPVGVAYRGMITPGSAGVLLVPGGSGRSIPSTVLTVGPSATPTDTDGAEPLADTFPVTVSLSNPSAAVLMGSTAYVRFPLSVRAPVAVNSLAVLGSDQKPFVMVVSAGRVEQRLITTGVSDGESTQVLSGLKTGEDVVISGGQHLIDGDQVQSTRSDTS